MAMSLNDRELGTVLAALRCFQQLTQECGGDIPGALHSIATNDDEFTSLELEEIDDLCERINGSSAPSDALLSHKDDIEHIQSVMMSELLGEHGVPEEMPEWTWLKGVASFSHRDNGSYGVLEFILNLANDFGPVPDRLEPAIRAAREAGVGYIIFYAE